MTNRPANWTRSRAVVIAEEILKLNDRIGVTSLVVSHDRDLAFGVADRIAVIEQGRILTIGTPDEVKRHPTRWSNNSSMPISNANLNPRTQI